VTLAVRALLGRESRSRPIQLDRVGHLMGMLSFDNRPCPGASTLMTTGLSELAWHQLDQELLMCLWTAEISTEAQLLLAAVARALAGGLEPLRQGDVLPPAGPLLPGTRMEALYVCGPRYFPEEMATLRLPAGRVVRLLWLIPIHESEAKFVAAEGASAFEAELVKHDPDLLSLARPPIV
jgi:hypothetical protein